MDKKTKLVAVSFTCLLLGACAQLGMGQPEDSRASPAAASQPRADGAAVTAAARPPASTARTQEALDTTTQAQRAQAAAPAAVQSGATNLGTTIASLGSPTEPGFWLKTPLVSTETMGRVTNKANGKSAAVRLIPIAGPASGGSQMSLPAMRLLEVSLTDLAEVEVTQDG